MLTVSRDVLDFLTGVHGDRNNRQKREEAIFDRAFKLAYKDMATHTVSYKSKAIKDNYVSKDCKRCNDNRDKIQKAIKEYVMQNIFIGFLSNPKKYCSKEKFDEWHEAACKSLVEIDCEVKNLINVNNKSDNFNISALLSCQTGETENVFSYGQAQKLINMMVKYLYIYYQCEGWDTLENIKNYAHVPIDRFVLKAAFQKEDYKGTPWSKIKTYEDYKICKCEIDNVAEAQNYDSGFLWELAKWPFEEER